MLAFWTQQDTEIRINQGDIGDDGRVQVLKRLYEQLHLPWGTALKLALLARYGT